MATKKEELNLSDVQKQIAEQLAALQAEKEELKRLLDEAKAKTNPKGSMTDEELAAHKAYMDEEVEIKLFRDNGKYKDDVFVGCNGETIAIKRGERVKIKRKFAEILDHSEHQDYETAQLIDSKTREFQRETERRGL